MFKILTDSSLKKVSSSNNENVFDLIRTIVGMVGTALIIMGILGKEEVNLLMQHWDVISGSILNLITIISSF